MSNFELTMNTPLRSTDYQTDRQFFGRVDQKFYELGLDPSLVLTKDEICEILDKKAGKMVDRGVLDELFAQITRPNDTNVAVSDFIRIYGQAEEILRSKIETCKANMESHKKQRDDCQKKAEDARLTESYTAFGIAQNSIVNVTILEARGLEGTLSARGTVKLFNEVSFGKKQSEKSKPAAGRDQHVWNEKFTFDVQDPDECLKIEVREHGKLGDVGFRGEIGIPLNNIQDQNIHDSWMDLYDKRGEKTGGEIHVKLQWIYSKVKYFSMIAQKWLDSIKKDEEDQRGFERQLQVLQEPFLNTQKAAKIMPNLENIQIESSHSPQSESQLDISANIVNAQRGSATHDASIMFGDMEKQVTTAMNRIAGKISNDASPSLKFWTKLTNFFCCTEILIGTLLMFSKSSFLEIIIPTVILLQINYGSLRELFSLKATSFVLLGTLFTLDFVWLIIDFKRMGDDKIDQMMYGGSGMAVIVIFLSILSMITKAILTALCYMLNIQLTKTTEGSTLLPSLIDNATYLSSYVQQ